MRVLEILLSKEQRDKDLSPADKKEIGLLKKKIDQYVDALSKPGTTTSQRASLHKKLTTAVAEVKKLSESLDTEVDYQVQHNDNRLYVVTFWIGDTEYVYRAINNPKHGWILEFIDNALDDDDMYAITGRGNSPQVMGAVVNITKDFLKQHPNADKLSFMAKEPSRESLYKRIVRKLMPDWDMNQNGRIISVTKEPEMVNELFQNSADWKWDFRGSEECNASFTINGRDYEFTTYNVGEDDSGNGELWDVEFKAEERGNNDGYRETPRTRDEIQNAQKKRFGVTGEGNAAEVFSTVVSIMRDFLNSKYSDNVTSLMFTAKEPSRKKLYAAMIKRLIPNWETSQDGGVFYVKKPQATAVMEAVHKVPLVEEDFEMIKDMLEHPIPATISLAYIHEVIVDDELTDVLELLQESEPDRDVRPLIVEWIRRVMPDQLWRFGVGEQTTRSRMGTLSPIHGYDPKMYKPNPTEASGNAYGKF